VIGFSILVIGFSILVIEFSILVIGFSILTIGFSILFIASSRLVPLNVLPGREDALLGRELSMTRIVNPRSGIEVARTGLELVRAGRANELGEKKPSREGIGVGPTRKALPMEGRELATSGGEPREPGRTLRVKGIALQRMRSSDRRPQPSVSNPAQAS
jgi:hypothetical protein